MQKEKNVNLQLLRVISMFLVIGVHITPKPFGSIPTFQSAFSCFLLVCNGCFYMLSGRFALGKVFNEKDEYKEYYIKKAITIVFPYVLVSSLYVIGSSIFKGMEEHGIFFII